MCEGIELVMNYLKNNKRVLATVLLMFYFISTYPLFTPDSVSYYSYLDFFRGTKDLSEWFATRGFVFPFFLWIGTLIAKNGIGLLVVLCILYMLFILLIYEIIEILIVKTEKVKRRSKGMIFLLIVINPIVYVMSHLVLTEFLAGVFLTFQIYLCISYFKMRLSSKQTIINALFERYCFRISV